MLYEPDADYSKMYLSRAELRAVKHCTKSKKIYLPLDDALHLMDYHLIETDGIEADGVNRYVPGKQAKRFLLYHNSQKTKCWLSWIRGILCPIIVSAATTVLTVGMKPAIKALISCAKVFLKIKLF